jgi:phosphohistidine phosphatase
MTVPMRQLLLLRHAKSSWDEPHLSDHARPLNMRGNQAAAAMAREMRRLGLLPDLVLVSSARRTLQTLAALEPWAEPPRIEPMDALYLAPASDLLDALRNAAPTARCVLLVGHNPGLHDLAMMLAGVQRGSTDKDIQRLANGYPSGALSEFTVDVPWTMLGKTGVRLTRLLLPSDLSEVRA